MSERQWSVYKKMLQLVTLIFPKLQSFGVTLCSEKRQCLKDNGLYIKKIFQFGTTYDIPKAAKFWCNAMQCEKKNV